MSTSDPTGLGFSTIRWEGDAAGTAILIDQTLLPRELRELRIRDIEAMRDAIVRLAVRGAPAIGIAAGYGFILGMRDRMPRDADGWWVRVREVKERLASSRPTAVNLFHALDRMAETAARVAGEPPARRLEILLAEALAIHREDAELCERIGRHGAALIRDGDGILTHCNAGALATGGIGTALAVIYAARRQGKRVRVWADETRPLWQGARLTAWELARAGIDVTVLCDGAAAGLIASGKVALIVTGADRIAMNGDTANKVGTYGVAALAGIHGVPFAIAAPTTTFDPMTANGASIPIEDRAGDEVTAPLGIRIAPDGVAAWNPAFDVTPAHLISAFITEDGIVRPPYDRTIPALLRARRPA
ncbi:MAG: S-methyl-5-thioribose-1-phosphate isomerase [Planctomycetes bacterium]|nr:S-methyl-5-thioribose-1-phosphate isomerase [Planctomycetota bacterium]